MRGIISAEIAENIDLYSSAERLAEVPVGG